MALHPPTIEHVQERGGELYIGRSRVTLSSAISAWKQGGQRPESITDAYPTLSLAAAYGAVTYYLDHQEELERYFEQGGASLSACVRRARPLTPCFMPTCAVEWTRYAKRDSFEAPLMILKPVPTIRAMRLMRPTDDPDCR